jgi:carnitine O-acetyltransferase
LINSKGEELSAAELEWSVNLPYFFSSGSQFFSSQVERVLDLAGNDKGIPVGALTGQNRDVWTEVRRKFTISDAL